MSQTFKIIQGADDIDLNQHAVIEASAGTGKTYTMVALVMRLLSDERDGLPFG
jgi:ATP-dependent exoDNAse (exonuclease V) beta subunit (contains helicase and exonuclease domains)